jgi:cytochrome b561
MLDKTSHPRNKTGSETKLLRYHPALAALHWSLAVLILVALATVLPLGTSYSTGLPSPPITGFAAIILMAVSGIVTAAAADLPAVVFGGSGAALPESFSNLPPRIAHGLLASAIVALVLLHILGTLYHHVFRKDQLLQGIWFGQRSTTESANQRTNDKED